MKWSSYFAELGNVLSRIPR